MKKIPFSPTMTGALKNPMQGDLDLHGVTG